MKVAAVIFSGVVVYAAAEWFVSPPIAGSVVSGPSANIGPPYIPGAGDQYNTTQWCPESEKEKCWVEYQQLRTKLHKSHFCSFDHEAVPFLYEKTMPLGASKVLF